MNGLIKNGFLLQRLSRTLIRYGSTSKHNSSKKKNVSYDLLIKNRRQESSRSILVQVSSENSFSELCNYCSQHGNVLGAHHFSIQHEDEQHYILIEFSSEAEAALAIASSSYNQELSGVPVRSPFLWFKAAKGKKSLKANTEQTIPVKLNVAHGTKVIENNVLSDLLSQAVSIDDQIQTLYEKTKLNDLGIRMRFLAAVQIEQAFLGMFPNVNAQPFGSSVNGFGKMGCDLDLILRFDNEILGPENKNKGNESRLIFHTKENLANGRSQTQRQMESIGDVLQLFLPGVSHVRRILQARVPIIKYHHEHLDLEVDLSMNNLSGFYMSELFYLFGEIDDRVRPLIFCVRRWANACGLTNPSPGRWITNFSLTCLVIFFLQQLKTPILPTINSLVKSAKPEDIRITEDGINCTFGRDMQKPIFTSKNTQSISELLLQFFEFYSQFDFHNRAISLNEGRIISKPDHSAVYIINPFEQVLNVSKNISLEECERLRIEVRNAAWLLESDMDNANLTEEQKSKQVWGLLNIFKTPEKSIIRPNMFFKQRMVEVSDLFENERKTNDVGKISEKTVTPIEYKDSIVKKQVQNIKSAAKDDLKSLPNEQRVQKSRRSR